MKIEISFHGMEISFHPHTDQAFFSTSAETEITHLLSTYMKKHTCMKDKPRKTMPAIHYLRGQDSPVFPKMKYFQRCTH